MSAPRSDEHLLRVVAAYREHKSYRKAARALGCDPAIVHRWIKRAAARGLMGTRPVLPGFEIKQTSAQIDAHGKTEKEWVQQRPESGDAFEMPAGHMAKGISALVDEDQRVRMAWIKTKIDPAQDVAAAIHAAFKQYKGRARLVPKPKRTDADLLSVYPIADQHVGLLAWARETGENYDLKVAAARLRGCMADLVAQSPPSRRALIVNLGDWQHNDDQRNVTPRSGNILDVDSRYFKILTTGVQLMQDCIELALQRHETVLVRNLPGNHDPHASIALTVALAAFYHRNKRVTIDDSPAPFFYTRFGATLIGATHGDKIKPADMAMTMAVERRKDWGETKFHWFLFGHIHRETGSQHGDVRVESFQSLASRDAFGAGRGYAACNALVSVTLHRRNGEQGRHRVNVPPPPHLLKAS